MGFVNEEDAIRSMIPLSKAYTSIKDIPAEEIQKLIKECNYYSYLYDQGKPLISDEEWDNMYFTIKEWEKITGIVYANSPTQNISYQTVSKLEPIEHEHLMLSLDKTKEPLDIEAFLEGQEYVGMFKMDGLTCSLTYENGVLIRAETRGNGIKGENILHNARVIKNIPQKISITNRKIVVDGEIICNISNFMKFQKECKNPRNFAAGSIRLLSAEECSKRNLEFIAWDLIEGLKSVTFTERLTFLKELGFTIVPYIFCNNIWGTSPLFTIKDLDDLRKEYSHYPIDGYVFKFNDIKYGEKKGKTAHHFKNAIAYKFYDELYQTTLKNIDWTLGRTGVLTPVAEFEPVKIEGTIVERASLHNISIMRDIFNHSCPYIGQPLKITKMNMIIPQVIEAENFLTKEEIHQQKKKSIDIIEFCPSCGSRLEIAESDNGTLNLFCINPLCDGRFINRLAHFCGDKGLDIKGISKATLSKLVDYGWIGCLTDIFYLKNYKNEWITKEGFGEISVKKILCSIEEKRTITLDRFLTALGIPFVGSTIAKLIAINFNTYKDFKEAVNNPEYSFTSLKGIGKEINYSFKDYNYEEADTIEGLLNIQNPLFNKTNKSDKLKGQVICITGKIKEFKNRKELEELILDNGGKIASAVTSKTTLLINNDSTSKTVKNLAAIKKGIPIMTVSDFIQKFLTN